MPDYEQDADRATNLSANTSIKSTQAVTVCINCRNGYHGICSKIDCNCLHKFVTYSNGVPVTAQKPIAVDKALPTAVTADRVWFSVEDQLPKHTGLMDGSTDDVLVYFGYAQYAPKVLVGFGEFTEDGFVWSFHGTPYDRDEKPTMWSYIEHPKDRK